MTAPEGWRVEPRAFDDPDVARLIELVQQEYVARYGGPDDDPTDVAEFTPPAGLFVLGSVSGVPAAMGGWRVRDDVGPQGAGAATEIKRMYVVDAHRRLGLSRLVLAELERSAAAAGSRRMVLATGIAQPEAIALYESSGYRTIAPFGRWAGTPGALFYGKALVDPARAGVRPG